MRNQQLAFLISIVIALFCLTPSVAAQTQSPPVFGPEMFTRDSGKPLAITRDFFVQDTSASYALIIRSGQNGAGRVSSAVIKVNDVVIAGPSDFNSQIGLLTKPVRLEQQNKISVELKGTPGTFITVTIQKGPVPTRLTLIDSRTDPLLFKVEQTDGRVIDYFGDRDGEGLPISIYAVRVQSPNGEASTYFFDEQQRLVGVVAANGVFFNFTWLSNTSVALTATAPNGDQIDVPIELPAQTASHHHSSLPVVPKTLPFSGANKNAVSTISRNVAALLAQGDSTSLVTVRHCNEAVTNASVELEVRPEIGDVQNYVYRSIGNGVYSLTFPNRDTGGDQRLGNRLCFAVTTVLSKLCQGLQGTPPEVLIGAVCPALSVGALFLGVPPPLFIAACALVAYDLNILCQVEGSFGDICELNRVVTNRIVRGRLSLNITARMPGAASPQFASLGTPVNGQYPPVTVNFPCGCEAGYGKRFVVNDNNTNVKITILPFEADFTNEIWLFNGGRTFFIGTNRQVGTVFDVGTFQAGTELVFGIRVRETAQTFRMGPGFRNPDRYAHGRVTCLPDGVKVAFEDKFGLADNDFDDAVFKITTSH